MSEKQKFRVSYEPRLEESVVHSSDFASSCYGECGTSTSIRTFDVESETHEVDFTSKSGECIRQTNTQWPARWSASGNAVNEQIVDHCHAEPMIPSLADAFDYSSDDERAMASLALRPGLPESTLESGGNDVSIEVSSPVVWDDRVLAPPRNISHYMRSRRDYWPSGCEEDGADAVDDPRASDEPFTYESELEGFGAAYTEARRVVE